MLRPLLPIALTATLLLTAFPAGASVHGVDWTATGVATDGSRIYTADLRWDGCLGCFFGVFTMTLTPAEGGAPVTTQFNGYESVLEHTDRTGYFHVSTVTAQSATTGVSFSLGGVQTGTTASSSLRVISQVLDGNFQGLTFTVATPVSNYHLE